MKKLSKEDQEKIIELLEKVSSNYYGCHFFIATHSPQIISGIKNDNTFILDLNTNLLKNSSKFKNRSSDFQLSEVFNFPGNNNEYLIRKLIIILNKLIILITRSNDLTVRISLSPFSP